MSHNSFDGPGPFDRWVNRMNADKRRSRKIAEFQNAAIIVNDSLEIAWASAFQCFGEKATPEHALKICEMMLSRIPIGAELAEE